MDNYKVSKRTDSFVQALCKFKELKDHIYDIYLKTYDGAPGMPDSPDPMDVMLEHFGDTFDNLESKILEQLSQSISTTIDMTINNESPEI